MASNNDIDYLQSVGALTADEAAHLISEVRRLRAEITFANARVVNAERVLKAVRDERDSLQKVLDERAPVS